MAKSLIGRSSIASLLKLCSSNPIPYTLRPLTVYPSISKCNLVKPIPIGPKSPNVWEFRRSFGYGLVNLVMSDGKPKFEMHETDPPKKDKWKNKKRFKQQKMREKRKRKLANKRDPRRLGVKGKKKKFDNAEERIKDKLEKAKIKESMLIERLKRYEVDRAAGPKVRPHELTGEERFYLKKMAQKGSNYVPLGRRGVFGGVILNMHLHWKKHETVKVVCKPCKPGQVHDYAREIARLSGGVPIQVIGDNTIVFYRGKDYVQPEVMSPVDTLSKKRALEKSKYEQSLESVRRFIAIAEKELELYYRHVALYGDPGSRGPLSVFDERLKTPKMFEPIMERDVCSDAYSAVSEEGMCSEADDDLESEENIYSEDSSSDDYRDESYSSIECLDEKKL